MYFHFYYQCLLISSPPTVAGLQEKNVWMCCQTVGSWCCFCGLVLRDTCCHPKQCCPLSPMWIIMKTQYPCSRGPAGPFSHQSCLVMFQLYSDTASLESTLITLSWSTRWKEVRFFFSPSPWYCDTNKNSYLWVPHSWHLSIVSSRKKHQMDAITYRDSGLKGGIFQGLWILVLTL